MVNIEDIIAYLKQGHKPIEHTVDELIFGQPEQSVKKIATTFNASIEVLKRAVDEGIELLISHEGIYYAHRGIPEGLEAHEVFKKKNEFIAAHDLAVFRYHDYIHKSFPDPITAGLVEQLNWHTERVEHQPFSAVVTLSTSLTVKAIIDHIKNRMQLPSVRLTGELHTEVNKIGLLVGFRGGAANALPLIKQHALDLLIVGEALEWETAEYITDCNTLGMNKAMITIGHMPSEAFGMKQLAERLQNQFPALHVAFLENKSCYKTI